MLEDLLGRVGAVSFHGNYVQEVSLLCRLHDLHDLSREYPVLAPVGRGERHVVHVLDRGECVEAEIGIDLVTVVEEGTVVVKRRRVIAVRTRDICHVFQRLLAELSLVRVLARSEELGAYSRQHLEFRVCRARAAGRYLKGSRCVVFIKIVEHRCRVL